MAASEKTAVRSFPKPELTDAEAGALEFPSSTSRSYNYFKPQRLRATTYEDVTFDVQPDPERYLTQGWLYGFAQGPGGYPQDWTELKASDWHRFRDPNEEWEQTIYRNNANVVRQISQNLANAKLANAYANWSSSWTKFVERNLGAWMHAEHGLGLHVFMAAQRSAPTNMINNAMAVNCAHKLRFAQDLALYNLDLDESELEFDGQVHREVWQQDPIWQGVRRNVELLTAAADWAEALFAAKVLPPRPHAEQQPTHRHPDTYRHPDHRSQPDQYRYSDPDHHDPRDDQDITRHEYPRPLDTFRLGSPMSLVLYIAHSS